MRIAEDDGKGKERKDASLFSLFPLSPAPLFSPFRRYFFAFPTFRSLFYHGYQGASAEERAHYAVTYICARAKGPEISVEHSAQSVVVGVMLH